MNFFAQLAGGGLVPNIYLYFYHIFRPIQRSKATPAQWKLDGAVCIAVLPSMVVGYYIPHFLGYFHSSLEARHWWSWLWQLFPVWVGILVAVISRAVRLNPAWSQWLDAPGRAFAIAKNTGYAIAFVNGAVDWMVVVTSGISLSTMFLPKYFLQNPETFHDAMQAILQYDYICCLGGFLLWTIYSFADVKAAGICDMSWTQLAVMAIIATPFLGLGNFLLIAWVVREDMIVAWVGMNSKQE
jgi:hypothetical protein